MPQGVTVTDLSFLSVRSVPARPCEQRHKNLKKVAGVPRRISIRCLGMQYKQIKSRIGVRFCQHADAR